MLPFRNIITRERKGGKKNAGEEGKFFRYILSYVEVGMFL
jgi:hypothetical protein